MIGVPGEALGLFVESTDGVVGFAPGRLYAGSPWTPVGFYLEGLLDNRFFDDQHEYVVDYGRQGDWQYRELLEGYQMEYEPRGGGEGWSSYDVFGGGLGGVYVLPLGGGDGGEDDAAMRRYLEQLQGDLERAADSAASVPPAEADSPPAAE